MNVKSLSKNAGLGCLVGMLALPWQASASELAQAATNPIGDLVQVQVQYQHGSNINDLDGNSDAYILQPVVPFDLPFKSAPKMVTRLTIPYVSTPDLPGSGSVDGFGDSVLLAFVLPKLDSKGQLLGIGPAIGIPTGNKEETGTDAWSLGPAAVYVNTRTKKTLWGALVYGLWDVGGEDDHDDVSQFNIQPIYNKYFNDGWYLGLQDLAWTYNDETDKWFVPIGPRLGKVTKIGSQHMNIFGGAYYNAGDDDNVGAAEWTFKLSFSFLFPK